MADHRLVVVGPAPPQQALDQQVVVELHQHHQLDLLAQVLEEGVEGFSLHQVAGEAIEQPAAAVALQAAAHDRQHQAIAHQFAPGHHRLRLAAQLRACGHFSPQQVARGEVQQATAGGQAFGLGALAGAGGAKEKKALFHQGLAKGRGRGWPGRGASPGSGPGAVSRADRGAGRLTAAPCPRSAGRSRRSAPAWRCQSPHPPGSAGTWPPGPGRSSPGWPIRPPRG